MTTMASSSNENNAVHSRKKSCSGDDGSYRIVHITRKQNEDSDEENPDLKSDELITKENDLKVICDQKTMKISDLNAIDESKRKRPNSKRLLFLYKASCESTSNEVRSPPSSQKLTNDLSQAFTLNEVDENLQLGGQNKIESPSEIDALEEAIDETVTHDEETLKDLLARADKLEKTFKKQDFVPIQRVSRVSYQQRRQKPFIIACSTVLFIVAIVIAIIIYIVVITLKRQAHINQVEKSSPIPDRH